MANQRPLIHSDTGVTQRLQPGDNLTLADNEQVLLGTGNDAAIYYDGTDLVVDPKAVGAGVLSVLGNVECVDIDATGAATLGSLLVVGAGAIGGGLGVVGDANVTGTFQCETLEILSDITTAGSKVVALVKDTGDADASVFELRVFPDSQGNLVIGVGAGAAITTSSDNVLLGRAAGDSVLSGNGRHVAIGSMSLAAATTNVQCVAIGFEALVVATGNNNFGCGYRAGSAITTGFNNVFLGTRSGADTTSQSATATNSIAIGTDSWTSGDGGVSLGPTANARASCVAIGPATVAGSATTSNAIGIGNTASATGLRSIAIGAGSSAGAEGAIAVGRNTSAANAHSIAFGQDITAAAAQAVFGNTTVTQTVMRGTVAGGGFRVLSGTNAMAAHVYNTHTSDTNMERLSLTWDSNVAKIQTEKGGSGGTARALALGTDGTVRTQIGSGGVIATGSCFQPAKTIAGYGSGTNYTVTNSSAEVDEGTDSAITIDQAGTYRLDGSVCLRYSGATFAGTEVITLKLRRTNNTAADVTNSAVALVAFGLSTFNGSIQVHVDATVYTTANTDDRIALFIDVSAGPSAGSLQVTDSHIFAERIA